MNCKDYLTLSASKKVLFVGDSNMKSLMKHDQFRKKSHYYENLIELMYDQPNEDYDASLVGYSHKKSKTLEAAQYIKSYLKKMPIYVMSPSQGDNTKISKINFISGGAHFA